MPDPRTSLDGILDELHEALESSDDLGNEARDRLRSAAQEIRQTIGDDESSASNTSQSLGDRLNDALESFEGKHPKITGIVGRIADALSDMGI